MSAPLPLPVLVRLRVPAYLRSLALLLIYFHWVRLATRSVGPNVWSHRQHTRVQQLGEYGACRSPENLKRERTNCSFEVILASTGQTGTTSVAQALRDMGYKTYHIEEKVTFGTPFMWDDLNVSTICRLATRCGLDAISLEPGQDKLPVYLEASPNAKVILTWRNYRSWANSADPPGLFLIPRYFENRDRRANFLKMHLHGSFLIIPWADLYDFLTGEMTRVANEGAMFAGTGQTTMHTYSMCMSMMSYNHPRNKVHSRGPFKICGQEESYLAHIDEIRRRVPPAQLLEFDVKKHSWAELTSFLGRPSPVPEGTPFPHPRVGAKSWSNDQLYDNAPDKAFPVILSWLVGHFLNYGLLLSWVAGLRAFLRRAWKRGVELETMLLGPFLLWLFSLQAQRLYRLMCAGIGDRCFAGPVEPYPHPTHMVAGS